MSESFRHRGVEYIVYTGGTWAQPALVDPSAPWTGDWELMGQMLPTAKEARERAEKFIDSIIDAYMESVKDE